MAARTVNDKPDGCKLLTAASARRTKGVRETYSMSDFTRIAALSVRATPGDWVAYSEPDVGLQTSLFVGTPGQSGFRPLEPLTGVDVEFVAQTVSYVRAASNRAAIDVLAERQRQVVGEGWSAEHDDHHDAGEMGIAAALYALPYESGVLSQDDSIGLHMLLELTFDWKLKPEPDRRKRLVKAGALILAEIERLDRAEAKDA